MTTIPDETIRLRTEEDVLAMVPFVFGFHPEASLVLVLLDAGKRPSHARLDLVDEPDLLAELADHVVAPLVRAARTGPAAGRDLSAFVLLYTDDRRLADRTLRAVADRLAADGAEIIVALRVAAGRWFRLGPSGATAAARAAACDGVPFDLSTHPLSARSVLAGDVTYASREELAASLAATDPASVAAVRTALQRLGPLPPDRPGMLEEGRWLRGLLARADRAGRPDAPTDPALLRPEVVARVARDLAHPDLRDLAWATAGRDEALRLLRWWRAVLNRCGSPEVAGPAAVLAATAWRSGDGALAWCAVERSLAADPGQPLARLVADLLARGVPPHAHDPVDPGWRSVLTLRDALTGPVVVPDLEEGLPEAG